MTPNAWHLTYPRLALILLTAALIGLSIVHYHTRKEAIASLQEREALRRHILALEQKNEALNAENADLKQGVVMTLRLDVCGPAGRE
jgi:cell division protein FtsB